MKKTQGYIILCFAILGFLSLPPEAAAQPCTTYTVNALNNCVGSNSPQVNSQSGLSIPVSPGQAYTLSIVTTNLNNAMDFGIATDSNSNPITMYGTRLRIYQYSNPTASDAVYVGMIGQGSAQEVNAIDPTPWGNLPVSMVGTDIFRTASDAVNYLIANPSFDTYSFTATTSFIALSVDDLLTGSYCGDNLDSEALQLCTVGGFTATPTSTPTNTPTPNLTNTPTNTPGIVWTSTPTSTGTITFTPTPPPAQADIFFISQNLMNPALGPVSIYVAYTLYPGEYSLKVYNSAGEFIKDIAPTQQLNAPVFKSYTWDGTNRYGNPCASGVYLIYLVEPTEKKFRRILLAR